MSLLDKFKQAVEKAKIKLAAFVETDGNRIGKHIKYSEDDILNAGITRDYKNKIEEREIMKIREERKMLHRIKARITNHKKSK